MWYLENIPTRYSAEEKAPVLIIRKYYIHSRKSNYKSMITSTVTNLYPKIERITSRPTFTWNDDIAEVLKIIC